ncbi:proteasome assembly chaperone family protein [Thermoproteus tenax]|uniref:ATP-grasp superfamily enzyme n=1 Tax=Thermoproteus tenax (strain ATCC 35583 / DSM 2078 / JCM 9277 / NBRC 100435 / Kra 1) TaxID=768679 RepID=G4RLV4_THETK|nr:PAC2 family protein [Thermoproteus tenax]CCC82549.1 ATP-grasp superfamily enzyme [Thermoproteus tenax Kra 1]
MKIIFKFKRPYSREIFVAGFHGVGLVGHIAVKHLSRSCETIGYIKYREMPPVVAYEGDRLALQAEIFSCDRVTGVVNNYGINDRALYDFIESLADWVVSGGFKMAVLFGGLDGRFKRSPDDLLRVAYTSSYIKSGFPLGDSKRLEQGLQIVGPLALLLSLFELYDFPALVILPYADKPADPQAASVALEHFGRLFGISVDTTDLKQLAEELEREYNEMRKQLEESKREESHYYI